MRQHVWSVRHVRDMRDSNCREESEESESDAHGGPFTTPTVHDSKPPGVSYPTQRSERKPPTPPNSKLDQPATPRLIAQPQTFGTRARYLYGGPGARTRVSALTTAPLDRLTTPGCGPVHAPPVCRTIPPSRSLMSTCHP
jgi:hypothetical protein